MDTFSSIGSADHLEAVVLAGWGRALSLDRREVSGDHCARKSGELYLIVFPTVFTEHLVLRAFTHEDTEGLLRIYQAPEVNRYLMTSPLDQPGAEQAAARRAERQSLRDEGDVLAVAVAVAVDEVHSGELVGDFSLKLLDVGLGRAEIGFILSPQHSGKGYATEAGRALLEIGFADERIQRVIGVCNADNISSQKLMSRLGMRREAHFVQAEMLKGEIVDTMLYAILRTEHERTRRRAGQSADKSSADR